MNTENTYNVEEKVEEFEKVAQFLDNSEPFKDRSNWLRIALQSAHAEGVKAGREDVLSDLEAILEDYCISGMPVLDHKIMMGYIRAALTPDNNV